MSKDQPVDELLAKLEIVPPDAKDAPLGLYDKAELKKAIQAECNRVRKSELESLTSPRYLRNVTVSITGSNGEVYQDASKLFISKYEVQERIAELQQLIKGNPNADQ